MSFNLKNIFSIVISSVLFFGCKTKPEEAEITILYTTDLHGAVLPYDFNKDKEATISLANVKTYVDEQRANNKDGIFLLDVCCFSHGQS